MGHRHRPDRCWQFALHSRAHYHMTGTAVPINRRPYLRPWMLHRVTKGVNRGGVFLISPLAATNPRGYSTDRPLAVQNARGRSTREGRQQKQDNENISPKAFTHPALTLHSVPGNAPAVDTAPRNRSQSPGMLRALGTPAPRRSGRPRTKVPPKRESVA